MRETKGIKRMKPRVRKMRWVAHWMEANSFTGKIARHWIDFISEDSANHFAAAHFNEKKNMVVALIARCSWHPNFNQARQEEKTNEFRPLPRRWERETKTTKGKSQ